MYRLTIWAGAAFHTLGRYDAFGEALAAYAACGDSTKQLVNDDRRDEDTTGLTDDEIDSVFALPATRAATREELMAALRKVA